VIQGDVGDLISAARSAFDAILLDVDNGPEGLMRAANDALYDSRGLEDAKAALRPGGLLSVWSSAPHARFEKRLRVSGFLVEEIRARAHQGSRGARHVVWIAKRP
jgi:spermidine synthase